IGLLVNSLVPMLLAQLNMLKEAIPEYTDQLPELIERGVEWLKSLNLPTMLEDPLINMLNGVEDLLDRFFDGFLYDLLNSLSALAKGLVDVIFIIILTIYFLVDGKKIIKAIRDFLPEKAREKLTYFAQSFNDITWRWLKNHAKISFFFALSIYLMLLIIGVDFAFFLAFLAFVLDFIPFFGSIIAGAIAVLVTLVTLGFGKAVLVGCLILLINQIEVYIAVPKVHSGSARIHPVAVIVSLLALNQLFGPLGMFVAVPVAGLVKIVIIEIRNFFLEK
ncbi:MAG: AI-2E family transporter, partial [Clostridiales bacterium]|nr:AI-2E family transporter [Clostridiales bacterium]